MSVSTDFKENLWFIVAGTYAAAASAIGIFDDINPRPLTEVMKWTSFALAIVALSKGFIEKKKAKKEEEMKETLSDLFSSLEEKFPLDKDKPAP